MNNTPKLHFVTDGTHFTYTKVKDVITNVVNHKNVATLGTFEPLLKEDLKCYVKKFPIHWVTL